MKSLKHYFVALVLIAVSFGAIAGTKVKDVENAMRAQNWSGAEQMLNQVLQQKPNSAKALYLLAQTHEQMGKRAQAAQELERARAADPTLKFASPGAVNKMAARLGGQTNTYAQAPVQRQPQVVQQSSYTTPTYQAPSGPSPAQVYSTAPAPVQTVQHSSGGAGKFIGGLLFLAILAVVTYLVLQKRSQKADEQRAQQRTENARRALLSRAVDLQTRTTDMQKTLKYESQEDSQLGLIVGNLVSNATSALSRLKGGTTGSFDAISEERKLNALDNEITAAEGRLNAKDFDGAKQAEAARQRQADVEAAEARTEALRQQRRAEELQEAELAAARRAAQPQPAPQPYYQPSPAPVQHTTTVVHEHYNTNNGGADLLTGVIIGEALASSSHHHHHDRDYDERGGQDGWSNRNTAPVYEAPAPVYQAPDNDPPALDFGGNDNGSDGFDNSPSDNGGGSVDTGSSSNDSDDEEF